MQKFNPGDPLHLPASFLNELIDLSNALRKGRHNLSAVNSTLAYNAGVVLVKNSDHDNSVPQYGVLMVDVPLFVPDVEPEEDDTEASLAFKHNPLVLSGYKPPSDESVSESHLTRLYGRFAVVLEPAPPGAIVPAVVSGMVQCPIDVDEEEPQYLGYPFADFYPGSSTKLRAAMQGAASIVWKQEGHGTKWAVVNIGPRVQHVFRFCDLEGQAGTWEIGQERFLRLLNDDTQEPILNAYVPVVNHFADVDTQSDEPKKLLIKGVGRKLICVAVAPC